MGLDKEYYKTYNSWDRSVWRNTMPDPRKWTMADAACQNERAERNLRHFKGSTREDRRWANRVARHVAEPARALFEFVYDERVGRDDPQVDRRVKTLLEYRSPRTGPRVDAPQLFRSSLLTPSERRLL